MHFAQPELTVCVEKPGLGYLDISLFQLLELLRVAFPCECHCDGVVGEAVLMAERGMLMAAGF